MSTGSLVAVVLAGGMGIRLRSVVADRPKVLAEVAGRPFLHHLLARLARAGFEHTILSVGYMAEVVRETCGERFQSMELHYAFERTPLGTGGALRQAYDLFGFRDSVLVCNGDSYCGLDFTEFRTFHDQRGGLATLAVVGVDDVSRYGSVELADDGAVIGYSEKGAAPGPGKINAGLYWFRPEFFGRIPAGRACSLEQELFARAEPGTLYGYVAPGPFLDIGTPESLASAEGFLGSLAPLGP